MTAIARIPVFLALGVGAWLAAQTGGRIGAFEDRADVGNPALKGTADLDAAKGEYRLTGAGANIWANADQFCYVWRRLSRERMDAGGGCGSSGRTIVAPQGRADAAELALDAGCPTWTWWCTAAG